MQCDSQSRSVAEVSFEPVCESVLVQPTEKELYSAYKDNDAIQLRKLCDGAELTTFEDSQRIRHRLFTAMEQAADIELLRVLIDSGVDPLAVPNGAKYLLLLAMKRQRIDYLEFLLNLGVDPNSDVDRQRATLEAVNDKFSPELQIQFLKLLTDHGAHLKHQYSWFGNKDNLFTVMDHTTNNGVKAYLRSVGAKTNVELTQNEEASQPDKLRHSHIDETKLQLETLFGSATDRTYSDPLQLGSGICVYVVEPTTPNGYFTLFTTGMSAKPMEVPQQLADHKHCELYMQLPGDWKLHDSDSRWSWPVQLLLDLAAYPHNNGGFFAFPVTSIANGAPPKPLGPAVNFTSTALIADEGFTRSDGETVDFFCVMPIYYEEDQLLLNKGVAEFVNALDAADVSRILDLNRASVVS